MSRLGTGRSIGAYRIEGLIGEGSMGTVYSALDVALDRRVALKVLTPELSRDERFRARFLRESRLAASLEHPHIVPIHAAGEADGLLYLAMRFVDGRDLASLLRSLGRLEPERVVAILAQVASALDVAHARGLVHRDVKPANILLTRHGEEQDYAYLCDFGLAKHASTVSSLTGSRAIVGTVDYLAPEQIEGRPVDGRVDVYALGCVLYECLAGEPPFRRGNELAALLAHVNDTASPLSAARAEIPEALDAVLASALAKEREQRYATCGELIAAARAALHDEQPAPAQLAAAPAAEAVRTFLFADVRGYTSYTREHGDEAAAQLARDFAALVKDLAPQHAGTLQELRGDEALVVFDAPRQALRFALELQQHVADERLERPVGIGIDAGEAVPIEGGYRGGALNRAARLCARAGPGEILATDAVRGLAGATKGVAYGFRRVERLKGFEKPVGLIEIHPTERAPRRELGRRARRAVAGTHPRARLAALALFALAGIAAILLGVSGGAGLRGPPFKANTVGLLDATSLHPAGSFSAAELGAPVLAAPDGAIWAGDIYGGGLVRIDPRTRQVTTHISFGINPDAFGFGAESVWAADGNAAAVNRYDARYGTLLKRIDLPTRNLPFAQLTTGLAFGAGSMWVSYGKYPIRVARIDPATNRVIRTIDFPNSDGGGLLAFGAGSLWVATWDRGRVYRVDPRTDQVVMQAKLHNGPVTDLQVVHGNAWMPVQGDGAVWEVDADGNVLRSVPTGNVPVALGSSGNDLYVANEQSQSISRIDTTTGHVTTVDVGHDAESAAVAGGHLWVALTPTVADVTANLSARSVARVNTVDDAYYSVYDPALFSFGGLQVQQAIGARLLRAPDVAQPRGLTLLPEIADVPVVSNHGRTYTFRIHHGYRFSPPSGAPVNAEVMRYSIERALSPKITDLNAYASQIVDDIVGIGAYRAGTTAHVSGIRVAGDRLSFTLTAPDADFPARISMSYFGAVPLGTPVEAHGLGHAIPSAGPYYIVPGNTLVLKRNPNYHGPRPHRLQAIVFAPLGGVSALQRVSSGHSDYTWASGNQLPASLQPGGDLDRRFGARSAAARQGRRRYFAPPSAAQAMIFFNTQSGIFRDPRLREAVNAALDRPALAATTGDFPAYDMVPPGIPGSISGRPFYPLSGPDLARARALAHGVHGRAVFFTRPKQTCDYCPTVAAILTANLKAIGIRVRTQPLADVFDEQAHPGLHWDMLSWGWQLDYPDPSDFVNALIDRAHPLPGLAFSTNWSRYNDQRYLRAMRSAYRIRGPARADAYRRLDSAMLLHSPAMAVYAVKHAPPQLFSQRIGCQVFRPQDLGLVDLAVLCIRGKS